MACLSLFHGIWRPSLEDPSGWVGAGTVRRLLHTPGARPGVTWTPAPARPVAGGQEHVGSSHSLGSLPAWQPRRSVVGVPPWSPPAATRSCTEAALTFTARPRRAGRCGHGPERSGAAQSVRKGTEMSQQEAGESKKSWPVLQTRRVLSTLLSKRLVVTCTERHGPAGPRGEGALGPAPPPVVIPCS